MKKQSNLSRLMGYAGGHKILTYLSWVLSVMSALLALVPFWYIWCIIHDILEVSPDFSQAENVTVHIPQELRIRSRGTERHSASN